MKLQTRFEFLLLKIAIGARQEITSLPKHNAGKPYLSQTFLRPLHKCLLDISKLLFQRCSRRFLFFKKVMRCMLFPHESNSCEDERAALQRDIKRQRSISSQELMQLRKDVANYRDIDRPDPERDRIEEHRRARHRTRRPSGP